MRTFMRVMTVVYPAFIIFQSPNPFLSASAMAVSSMKRKRFDSLRRLWWSQSEKRTSKLLVVIPCSILTHNLLTLR